MSTENLPFPLLGYYLDESDPDVLVLRRRRDGAFVAAFSVRGATIKGILEAAEEDHRNLLREHAGTFALPTREYRNARAPSTAYLPESAGETLW